MPSSFIPVPQEEVVPTDGAPFESVLWRDVAAIPASAPLADQVMHDLALAQVFAAIEADSPIVQTGLTLCLPRISESAKILDLTAGWNLALASRLPRDHIAAVTNNVGARLPAFRASSHTRQGDSVVTAYGTPSERTTEP